MALTWSKHGPRIAITWSKYGLGMVLKFKYSMKISFIPSWLNLKNFQDYSQLERNARLNVAPTWSKNGACMVL